jgi:hypothetical protein
MIERLKQFVEQKPFRPFRITVQPWDGKNLGPPKTIEVDESFEFSFHLPEIAFLKCKDGRAGVIGAKSILAIECNQENE